MLTFKTLNSKLTQVAAVAALAFTANVSFAQTSDGFDAQTKYMASCFACHSTGAAGAPKVQAGTYDSDWAPRLEKGMDAVMANATNGVNAMPAKGMCFDCNEADLRAIVDWMIAEAKK